MSTTLIPVLARLLGLALCCAAGLATAATLKVGVIGGGGHIGQRVVDEALARGHAVTLVARDPAKIERRHERLVVVAGDALDRTAMQRHLAGLDVVVSAVGTGRVAGSDGSIYRAVAESLVSALRALGATAPRLIVVGGFGSLQTADGGLALDRVPSDRMPEHRGQKAALDYLRGVADVRWSYASPPGRIAPGTRTGSYRLGADALLLDAQGRSAMISMEDFAVALIDEAERGAHVGRRFTVAN
jgi:putative NADH-flavin reductase